MLLNGPGGFLECFAANFGTDCRGFSARINLRIGSEMKIQKEKLVILGSGPAGWTAAVYAARAGLDPLVVAGTEKGGQLMSTSGVENWPGEKSIMGPELMGKLEEHALACGSRLALDHVERADLGARPFKLYGSDTVYETEALIVCTGASAKYLGLESEEKFKGRGVSACATCDGFFYRNREVAVVGGGNSAVEEALYLSRIASKVHLVHRKGTFRAEKIMQRRLMERVAEGKIELHLNRSTKEIVGDEMGVSGILLEDAAGAAELVPVHGVFVAIGHKPNTDIFKGALDMDEAGYILTKKGSHSASSTNVKGVFAAGDVQDSVYRQAITSAGAGCQAALDALAFLDGEE